MGYTHSFLMNRDLTGDEFEDISSDVRRIVDVAMEQGIGICGDEYSGLREAVLSPELICLNGVGAESAEALQIWRKIPWGEPYQPALNFCKTYRRKYSPVVEASIIALKQRTPHDVMVGSDGGWGYEWLHGPRCDGQNEGQGQDECRNTSPEHVRLGGRELYRLAFPDSPTPMNVFQSPLVGTELEGQLLYVPRKVCIERRGSCFEGVPFGVTLRLLIEQKNRQSTNICMMCGEMCASSIKTVRPAHAPLKLNAPMCEFCYRERVASGKVFGYRFARNPYRLTMGVAA